MWYLKILDIVKAIPKWVWLCVIIAVLACMLYKSAQLTLQYKERAETFETTISDLNQKITETKIQMNDSITLYQAEVKNLNYSADNLQAKYNNLLKASNLKAKDVNNVTDVTSQIVSHDTVYVKSDSIGNITANSNDGFVNIDVMITPAKKAIIDYEVHDSISVINVQKKHSILFGLIKWKSLESTRVVNYNPKAHITSLQTVNVIE